MVTAMASLWRYLTASCCRNEAVRTTTQNSESPGGQYFTPLWAASDNNGPNGKSAFRGAAMNPRSFASDDSAAERRSIGEWFVRNFQYLADVAPVRSRRASLLVTLLVIVLLGLTASVVFNTDGTGNPFLHLAYAPVIIASLALGLL